MAEKYYSVITNRGRELEAESTASGLPVILKSFVVGDGNGTYVTPDPARTSLVNEVYRGEISDLSVSQEQSNQWIARIVIPNDIGGFTIREIGILTDAGELYASGSCAAIDKPTNGVSVNYGFTMAVSETAEIELIVPTGDGLFLRQDANLSDVKDKAKSRENLELGSLATKNIDFIYPVGIVTWFAQNKNPNTLFPGTTWKYIGENKTVRLASASGGDVLSTGGSDSITLSASNIPSHNHSFSASTSSFNHGTKSTNSTGAHTHSVSGTAASAGAHTHGVPGTGSADGSSSPPFAADGRNSRESTITTESSGAHTHAISGTAASAGNHAHTVDVGAHTHTLSGTTGSTGSGASVSIVNAYIKLMGWYRSA